MSIDTIKQELANLDSPHRNHLVAYLVSLNDQESSSYRADLASKIDDMDQANWATIDDFDRRFSVTNPEKNQ
jgi:hypothetical protein